MKPLRRFFPQALLLIISIGCLSCGPNREEIISEIQAIDFEMQHLLIAARRHSAQRNSAELEMFLGSFATGYGATTDNYALASDGYRAAANASTSFDYSNASIDLIVERAEDLMNRRAKLAAKLK